VCTDGSTSKGGRGACSSHGGVKASANAAAKRTTASLPAPVAATSPARTNSEAKSQAPSATTGGGGTDDRNPAGAIAQCKDRTFWHSKTKRGACTGHGGVSKWM
jgi:hypothetical protein